MINDDFVSQKSVSIATIQQTNNRLDFENINITIHMDY